MTNDFESKAYLGQGVAFPFQVNARGEIALVSGYRDIEQSIRIILGTQPGERVMRPEFGCRARELLFEPHNASTRSLMKQYIVAALNRWEPRIAVQSVSVSAAAAQDGAIVVEINYLVKTTHDRRSIVYPFFLVGEETW